MAALYNDNVTRRCHVDDKVSRIVEACRAGRPQKDVAAEFGVTQSAVSAIARTAGITRRRQLTDEQADRVRALKAEGKGYAEIAELVGCSWQVAYTVATGRRHAAKVVSKP
jgi:DNA invertase Pin-like site-specific DNA recombinase